MLQCIVPHHKMAKKNDFFWLPYSTVNFLKSTHILKFPFLLDITTIGDNHVTSSIGWMNPSDNSLSTFCLTTTT